MKCARTTTRTWGACSRPAWGDCSTNSIGEYSPVADTTGAAGFGYSVSISGNYAIVGASKDDVGANTDQGSATIYLRIGLGWQKVQYITDPGGNANDQFGGSAAIDGVTKRFLIGIPRTGKPGQATFGKINQ